MERSINFGRKPTPRMLSLGCTGLIIWRCPLAGEHLAELHFGHIRVGVSVQFARVMAHLQDQYHVN